MTTKPKAILSWSGGKDSAYCLDKVLTEGKYDVKYLLTSLSEQFRRVSMHGVREDLLDAQADAIGRPLLKVWVREGTNEEYERQMEALLLQAKAEGIEFVIFGDIFLEDLRAYREANLAKVGMQGVFPLWKMDTSFLIHDFLNKGFATITCCVNDAHLDESWVGREIDSAFVTQLPMGVDPCGENGEYHTCCYAGPVFRKAIPITTGEKIYRPLDIQTTNGMQPVTRGFWFCDLLLA